MVPWATSRDLSPAVLDDAPAGDSRARVEAENQLWRFGQLIYSAAPGNRLRAIADRTSRLPLLRPALPVSLR